MTLQQKIWEIVEMHETQEAYWFDKFIITLISLFSFPLGLIYCLNNLFV